MNDRELTALFRRELDEMGFCDKFKELWRDNFTRSELIGLYRRGIEYCIEHDWPGNGFIKKHFDIETLREGRVYVDDEFGEINGENGVYVFNGASSGVISFDGFATATVYVRQACDITINVKGLSRVFVELYDHSSVSINQKNNASVFVYVRDENAKLQFNGKVNVRR